MSSTQGIFSSPAAELSPRSQAPLAPHVHCGVCKQPPS